QPARIRREDEANVAPPCAGEMAAAGAPPCERQIRGLTPRIGHERPNLRDQPGLVAGGLVVADGDDAVGPFRPREVELRGLRGLDVVPLAARAPGEGHYRENQCDGWSRRAGMVRLS